MSDSFVKLRDYANTFQGMMTDIDIALWDALLSFQRERGIVGDGIEFGVYKGKSASVAAHHFCSGETLHLVEPNASHPDVDRISGVGARIQLHISTSERFLAKLQPNALFRFSHHDANHTFNNVSTELSSIWKHLVDGALVILDDFTFTYSQVMAAYFHQRYSQGLGVEIFLLSGAKAYCCGLEDFPMYEDFVLGRLLSEMEARNFPCMLARTDNHDKHRALYIRKRTPDEPALYGTHIWGDRYYKPSNLVTKLD